jgi:hypothetical protein
MSEDALVTACEHERQEEHSTVVAGGHRRPCWWCQDCGSFRLRGQDFRQPARSGPVNPPRDGVEERLVVTDLCDLLAFEKDENVKRRLRRAINFIEGCDCFPGQPDRRNNECGAHARSNPGGYPFVCTLDKLHDGEHDLRVPPMEKT